MCQSTRILWPGEALTFRGSPAAAAGHASQVRSRAGLYRRRSASCAPCCQLSFRLDRLAKLGSVSLSALGLPRCEMVVVLVTHPFPVRLELDRRGDLVVVPPVRPRTDELIVPGEVAKLVDDDVLIVEAVHPFQPLQLEAASSIGLCLSRRPTSTWYVRPGRPSPFTQHPTTIAPSTGRPVCASTTWPRSVVAQPLRTRSARRAARGTASPFSAGFVPRRGGRLPCPPRSTVRRSGSTGFHSADTRPTSSRRG